MPTLDRVRRRLALLSAIAIAWAFAVAVSGGFVVTLGPLRLSSRAHRTPALLALVAGGLWLLLAGRTRTRRADGTAPGGGPGARPGSRASATAALAAAAPLTLLLVGIGLAVWRWSVGRSLWLDEQMIALNFRDRTFGELPGTLWLGQSAPLGWLALERAAFLLLGDGERALRVVPLLFRLGTLVTAWWVARRWLGAIGGPVLVALVACGEWVGYYGDELKPYSADQLFGLLLPAVLAWSLEGTTPESRRWRGWGWWMLAGAGQWVANGALLVTPACALVGAVGLWRRDGWRGVWAFVAGGGLWLAMFGLHFVLAIRATLESPFLTGYWVFAMPPADAGLLARLRWIAARLPGFADTPGGTFHWIYFWGSVIAGAVVARRRPLVATAALVAASLFAFTLLRMVPLFERLSLWAVPALYLLIAAAATWLAERAAVTGAPSASTIWHRAALALSLAAIAWLVLDVAAQGGHAFRITRESADNHQLNDRDAVADLLALRQPGDVVISTNSALPALWWYGGVPVTRGGAWPAGPTPSPLLDVSWRAEADCGEQDLDRALAGASRALVYFGFRFNDAPQDLDLRLRRHLTAIGELEHDRKFGGAGGVMAVRLSPAERRGASGGEEAAGCFSAVRAEGW